MSKERIITVVVTSLIAVGAVTLAFRFSPRLRGAARVGAATK